MRSYNNFDLTNYNSYRLNSICKNAYFPENEEEFINLYFQNNLNYRLQFTKLLITASCH